LDIVPNFIFVLNRISNALNYLGKYKEDIKFCDKTLTIYPDYIHALNGKGAFSILATDEEAIEWYEKALELDSNFVFA
jgi:tetratricopeptide (TPR) repeat protein